MLLYFIEIDILGYECICASILLLLYVVALYVLLRCSILLASYSFAAASLLHIYLLLPLPLALPLSSASTCNGKVNIENGKWELQTMDC